MSALKLKKWTKEDTDLLRREYPHSTTEQLARKMGRSVGALYERCRKLGIKKAEGFKRPPNKGRFKRGVSPWNKGLSGFRPAGSEVGHFKKGSKPPSTFPIGTFRMGYDGVLKKKVSNDRRNGYVRLNILRWMRKNGPVPKDHVVIFADGDKTNYAYDNLILVSRPELMLRNSIYNYPKPVVEVIKLNAKLRKIIKERT